MSGRARIVLPAVCALFAALAVGVRSDAGAVTPPALCEAPSYVVQSLSGTAAALRGDPLLRFVNLSDSHILDDDASTAMTATWMEAGLEPTIGNNSAQRLQEEFTDEVLNAMEKTVNACVADDAANGRKPLEFMIATGDLTDNMTLNETRRYIDNLDGESGALTAYERHCGYTTHDSRGVPKLGAGPCTPEMQAPFAVPTGRLVADTQQPTPDLDDPTYQAAPTRSVRQLADTTAASLLGLSHNVAPGLPPSLRCSSARSGCDNVKLAIPHYAVFGNHDIAVRGTATMQQPFQAGAATFGRYFFESQRELVNEFFATSPTPGPVGHGFNHAGDRLHDADDRNDGWYAFDAAGGKVRMVVINTIFDGVQQELHRDGATNAATGGLVAGNEATNPIGLEQGAMSRQQYDWLAAELAAADKPVLVFSHHPDRSFTERRLGRPADGGHTAAELNELLGRHGNVVAHIAGHTHENIVRACRPGPGGCPIGGAGGEPAVAHGFWRVETASLVDYPQEGRIVEVFRVPGKGGRPAYALRLTMVQPDPGDPTAALSKRLSEAEATCTTSAVLGGPLSNGPYNPSRLEAIAANAGEAAVRGRFCQGQASLALAAGRPTDRDTVLLP